VVRIEIRDGIHSPLVITDEAIVGKFDIWNGPGVRTYTNGAENAPAHLDATIDDGRFIDWPAGVARQRAEDLPRFEVSFKIQTPRDGIREYLIAYEFDVVANQGYIYLPRWENSLIWHGVEGDWFLASNRWDTFVTPLIASHVATAATSVTPFRCTGTARIDSSGTIDIQFVRDGAQSGRWRFTRATEGYPAVAKDVGNLKPGVEAEVSCWPRDRFAVSRSDEVGKLL
jgi:hypothetical protein